jgi:DNA-binding NarL/FixJ family response regulator
MDIAVHLANQLISQAVCQLLLKMGNVKVATSGKRPADGFTADVLLVDVATLGRDLLTQYPTAKVLFIDTGIPREKLCATLLSYRVHGVLSVNMELPVLKKALKTVSKGQIWIDNGSVKASSRDTGAISRPGKISGVTGREQEIIDCICRGWSNQEIARQLALSENTVKSHLNRIFRKLHITSRSKLITLALD